MRLHLPLTPEQRNAANRREGAIDRRSAIKIGVVSTALAAMAVLVGGHGHDE